MNLMKLTSSSTTASTGIVDFNFLTIDDCAIQFSDCLVGSIIVSHGYESVALFSDVHISNFTTSIKNWEMPVLRKSQISFEFC